MESARDLLARKPQSVLFDRGTVDPSVHPEPDLISARFLHHWHSFKEYVATDLSGLNLDGSVSISDSSEPERYTVGNETGLMARFIRNVCDPVVKALSVTTANGIMFGDIQSVKPLTGFLPDLAIIDSPTPDHPTTDTSRLIAVGELKTFWTCTLANYPARLPVEDLRLLERVMGQLVSYMRGFNLKYGFVSTYGTTVFVRRTQDFRFELSEPIDHRSERPTLRECFLVFLRLAAQGPEYHEDENFIERQLWSSGEPGMQASTRNAPLLSHVAQGTVPDLTVDGRITTNTILFGESGSARYAVECVRIIHQIPEKVVMEVQWQGRRALAKCWTGKLHTCFEHERTFYNAIYQRRPEGYPFFANFLAHGEIVLSSIMPVGNILIISWVDGEPLTNLLPTIDQATRLSLRAECRRAVVLLRELGIYVHDSGPHNVLYSRSSHQLTMINFELYSDCAAEGHRSLDKPELESIFGRPSEGNVGGG